MVGRGAFTGRLVFAVLLGAGAGLGAEVGAWIGLGAAGRAGVALGALVGVLGAVEGVEVVALGADAEVAVFLRFRGVEGTLELVAATVVDFFGVFWLTAVGSEVAGGFPVVRARMMSSGVRRFPRGVRSGVGWPLEGPFMSSSPRASQPSAASSSDSE